MPQLPTPFSSFLSSTTHFLLLPNASPLHNLLLLLPFSIFFIPPLLPLFPLSPSSTRCSLFSLSSPSFPSFPLLSPYPPFPPPISPLGYPDNRTQFSYCPAEFPADGASQYQAV